jgi:HK97 family phage portal protein
VTTHVLLYGNAFLRKHRDSLGLVDELVLLNPSHIIVYWDGDQRIKQFNYQPLNGQLEILGPEDVIHIYGFSTDGVIGESVIGRCKNTFGVAMARDQFEGGFYLRGGTLSGVVEAPRQMSPAAAERLKASINAIYGGSSKAFQIGLLEEGAKFHTVGSPLKDIQIVEAAQLTRTEIASMFHLPPNYLGGSSGDSLTYATVESNQIQFALHAIAPMTNTIARALAADPGIFPQNNAYDAEFDIDRMLRADAGARADYYQKMAGIRAMTRNEIRRREDLPPVPGGDTFDDVPTTERITAPTANTSTVVTTPSTGGSVPNNNGNGNGALPQGAPNGS